MFLSTGALEVEESVEIWVLKNFSCFFYAHAVLFNHFAIWLGCTNQCCLIWYSQISVISRNCRLSERENLFPTFLATDSILYLGSLFVSSELLVLVICHKNFWSPWVILDLIRLLTGQSSRQVGRMVSIVLLSKSISSTEKWKLFLIWLASDCVHLKLTQVAGSWNSCWGKGVFSATFFSWINFTFKWNTLLFFYHRFLFLITSLLDCVHPELLQLNSPLRVSQPVEAVLFVFLLRKILTVIWVSQGVFVFHRCSIALLLFVTCGTCITSLATRYPQVIMSCRKGWSLKFCWYFSSCIVTP